MAKRKRSMLSFEKKLDDLKEGSPNLTVCGIYDVRKSTVVRTETRPRSTSLPVIIHPLPRRHIVRDTRSGMLL